VTKEEATAWVTELILTGNYSEENMITLLNTTTREVEGNFSMHPMPRGETAYSIFNIARGRNISPMFTGEDARLPTAGSRSYETISVVDLLFPDQKYHQRWWFTR